jgi:translation initiation factor IF-1
MPKANCTKILRINGHKRVYVASEVNVNERANKKMKRAKMRLLKADKSYSC